MAAIRAFEMKAIRGILCGFGGWLSGGKCTLIFNKQHWVLRYVGVRRVSLAQAVPGFMDGLRPASLQWPRSKKQISNKRHAS